MVTIAIELLSLLKPYSPVVLVVAFLLFKSSLGYLFHDKIFSSITWNNLNIKSIIYKNTSDSRGARALYLSDARAYDEV